MIERFSWIYPSKYFQRLKVWWCKSSKGNIYRIWQFLCHSSKNFRRRYNSRQKPSVNDSLSLFFWTTNYGHKLPSPRQTYGSFMIIKRIFCIFFFDVLSSTYSTQSLYQWKNVERTISTLNPDNPCVDSEKGETCIMWSCRVCWSPKIGVHFNFEQVLLIGLARRGMDTSGFCQVGRHGTLSLLKRQSVPIGSADDSLLTSFGIDDDELTFGSSTTCDVRLYYSDVDSLHCKIVFDQLKVNVFSELRSFYDSFFPGVSRHSWHIRRICGWMSSISAYFWGIIGTNDCSFEQQLHLRNTRKAVQV